MSEVPRIKGLAFRSTLSALEALRGADAVARALDRMPPELATKVRHGEVVPSAWVPVAWYAALLDAIRGEPEGDALLREIGRVSAQADMTGIHRALYRMLGPTTIMKVVGRVYGRYFTRGSVRVVSSATGYLRVRWVDCQGFNRAMWLDAYGAATMILELAGVHDLSLRLLAGGQEGDTTMEVEARYR